MSTPSSAPHVPGATGDKPKPNADEMAMRTLLSNPEVTGRDCPPIVDIDLIETATRVRFEESTWANVSVAEF
jgi:hypothetical protein